MKVLVNETYKGHEIVIKGSFGWNDWKDCNCVRLYTYIYKNNKIIQDYIDCILEEKPFKILFWLKRKSLKQLTEEALSHNHQYCKDYIDRELFEQEMTDGLMDSLDNLK